MAQLIVQVLTDRSQFDSSVKYIEQKKQELEKGVNVPINVPNGKGIPQQFDGMSASAGRAKKNVTDLATSFLKLKVINSITGEIKDSLSTMKAVDDELVTIRKVTDATAADLEKMTARAYDMGSKYGMGANDFLANVAEFSRAGYGKSAEGLGELAVKTQLVGDMSQKTATQMLLSVDAAYQYQGSIEKLSAVLDGMNAIDNNFATSMGKVSAGLGKVAPIAAQAHTGVDELSAAIGTITAVTQRSGEEAATALRALFLNIMGDTKTEIEDGATWTAGEIDGLRDVLEKYAPAAVKAAEATGEVINPMEAIGGLAQSMKEGLLTEQELMAMVTDIGGKLRSSQLLALIQNWDMYEAMLTEYQNAAGSADKEVSKMMDSWSVKAERLSNAVTKQIAGVLDTRMIKGGLDLLTALVDELDSGAGKVITFAAAMTGLYAVISGIGRSQTLGNIVSFFKNNWQVTAIAAAAAFVYQVYDALTLTTEELEERAAKAKESYESEQTALNKINTELDNNKKRIEELKSMGPLNYTDAAELKQLQEATLELEKQKTLQAEITAARQREAAYAALDAAEEYSGYDPKIITLLQQDQIGQLDVYGKNINDLIVAYGKIAQLKHSAESPKEIEYYNEMLTQTKKTALENADALQEFLNENKSYYDSLIQKNEELYTAEDKAFREYYEKTAPKIIEETFRVFAPDQYERLYLTESERAQKAASSYVSSIQKQIQEKQALLELTKDGSEEEETYAQEINALKAELDAYNEALSTARMMGMDTWNDEDLKAFLGGLNLTNEAATAVYNSILAIKKEKNEAFGEAPEITITNADGTEAPMPQAPAENTLKTYVKLEDAVAAATTKYGLLKQAMAEVNATGRVAENTFHALEELGIDIGDAYKDDAAGGFKVLGTALEDALEESRVVLNELGAETDVFERIAEDAAGFADEIRDAESALSELQNELKQTGEVGDLFKDYQDAYQSAMELFNKGMVGSREFQGVADLILGDDVMRSLKWDYQKAGEMLGSDFFKAMFSGDEEDYGRSALEYLAENFERVVDKSGRLAASFKKTDDGIESVIYDFEAFAEAVGASEDVLMALFDAWGIWGDGLNTTRSGMLKMIDGLGDGVIRIQDNIRKVDFDKFVKKLASLGKSEKEITKLYETAKEMPEIRFEGDTDDVTEKIQKAVEESETFAETEYTSTADVNNEPAISSLNAATQEGEAFARKTFTAKANISFGGFVGGAAGMSLPGFGAAAEGTDNAPGGPTLVNERGPEIISQNGKAFIANGGKPAVVNLEPGAIVLDAEETKRVRGAGVLNDGEIGAAAAGVPGVVKPSQKPSTQYIPSMGITVPTKNYELTDKGGGYEPEYKNTTTSTALNKKKTGSGGGSSGGRSGKDDEEDPWDVISDYYQHAADMAERAIDRIAYQIELIENEWDDIAEPLDEEVDALDRLNDQLDRQIELLERERDKLTKPLDERIDAMREAKDLQDEQLELAERQKAVEEARANLQNAQNERNIRYFNAEKGQWEWMADQRAVQEAEDALKDAEKSLADYEYEMEINALERERDAIESEYEAKIVDLEEKQLANEDAIYELEQKLLALEDKYNAMIKPLEREQTLQERELEALNQKWADIELKAEEIEGDLDDALGEVSGTEEGQAAKELLDEIHKYNDSLIEASMDSIWKGSPDSVPTLDGVIGGLMSGSSGQGVTNYTTTTTNSGNTYTNSNNTNTNSNNVYYINGVRIDHPNAGSMTLDELMSMGIYENMNS